MGAITLDIRFDTGSDPLLYTADERLGLAEALRGTPGQWALLGRWPDPRSLRQTAYMIRLGGSGWAAFGPGFEAETHSMLGEHRMYVRYIGETGGAA